MQFRLVLALGIIFAIAFITPHSAYGHGCQTQGCAYAPWPTAILSSYSDVVSIVSAIGAGLVVAMLVFRFEYLKRRDFCTTRYSPTADHINHMLFDGRDKRKIIVSLPFLIFGGYLVAAGIYSMLVFENLRNIDIAIMVAAFSLPFFSPGIFLLTFGIKAISFVTLKKEPITA